MFARQLGRDEMLFDDKSRLASEGMGQTAGSSDVTPQETHSHVTVAASDSGNGGTRQPNEGLKLVRRVSTLAWKNATGRRTFCKLLKLASRRLMRVAFAKVPGSVVSELLTRMSVERARKNRPE
jgi:hypothetical protein